MILDAGPPLEHLAAAGCRGCLADGSGRAGVLRAAGDRRLAVNTPQHFTLASAAGPPAGLWTSTLDAVGHQVVRYVPTAPYANSTAYSLTITGRIHDRSGRTLTTSGNVGSSFRTADTIGPAVIGTLPDLVRPVPPLASIRFDFSEAVRATSAQLDGDLVGDAVELYGESLDAGVRSWHRLPDNELPDAQQLLPELRPGRRLCPGR